MTIIWFILILGVIILVHEFGHFIFAKWFGVYVYEFSLGMGPKIWSKKAKDGETEYCIRAIPLGGFVRLAGEEVDDDEKIDKDRKLYNKNFIQRFFIMFAGAMNNFILCFVVLLVSAFIFGSVSLKPIVSSVSEEHPAYEAGIGHRPPLSGGKLDYMGARQGASVDSGSSALCSHAAPGYGIPRPDELSDLLQNSVCGRNSDDWSAHVGIPDPASVCRPARHDEDRPRRFLLPHLRLERQRRLALHQGARPRISRNLYAPL